MQSERHLRLAAGSEIKEMQDVVMQRYNGSSLYELSA